MTTKKCIGFGANEGSCKNDVDPKVNPIWCPECNAIRIAHLSKQMNDLMGAFK